MEPKSQRSFCTRNRSRKPDPSCHTLSRPDHTSSHTCPAPQEHTKPALSSRRPISSSSILPAIRSQSEYVVQTNTSAYLIDSLRDKLDWVRDLIRNHTVTEGYICTPLTTKPRNLIRSESKRPTQRLLSRSVAVSIIIRASA